MRANPGGEITPDQVVGRDDLIARLWRVLEGQSVLLSAERRMGKTCVVKKMRAAPPSGTVLCYHDLEAVTSLEQFALLVAEDMLDFVGGGRQALAKLRSGARSLRGVKLGSVEVPANFLDMDWQAQLREAAKALSSSPNGRLVLLWDEFPHMLQRIAMSSPDGLVQASDLLALLRSLRETCPALRMVLTGSIGLHQVLRKLTKAGFPSAPTNDLFGATVEPLAPRHAVGLAVALLEGENLLPPGAQPDTAVAVVQEACHVPFYIHHIVDRLVAHGVADPEAARQVARGLLTDPDDPCQFAHFCDRIRGTRAEACYYEADEAPYVYAVLDVLAEEAQPLAFPDLADRVTAQDGCKDSDAMRNVLLLMQRDHYIRLGEDDTYEFQLELLKRWWHIHRS